MAGTYSDTGMSKLPAALADCGICPEHYYCPLGTDSRYKYPCTSGTYCPPGSTWPILCPAGKYCFVKIQNGLNTIVI
jgi:hypothetical protein